jgi:hypothetical protein
MRKALATRTGSAWFFAKPASDSQYSLYTFSGREMIGLFSRLGAWSIPFTMPAHAPRNDAFDARCHPLIPSALSAHFVPRPGIVHLRLHLLYALSHPGCGLSQRS